MTQPYRPPRWDQHGGFYRRIDDLKTPWVASPVLDKPEPSAYVYVQPFIIPAASTNCEKLPLPSPAPVTKRRNTIGRIFRILADWIGKRRTTVASPHQHPEDEDDFPREVPLREWKAWGYYARPTLNDVDVQNYPPVEGLSPTIDVDEVFASLRDPDGSRHPERWIPGLQHPAIPPRPKRWIEPSKGDPLPFPWECQLNPFLQHLPFGPPPLCWDIGKSTATILVGKTVATIPLSPADKSQPATYPFVTHMYINAIADDPLPIFPWPIMVYNPRGIKCEDVFQAIYMNFRQHVALSEFESWDGTRQNPAKLAFEARWGQARDERMRRSDFLGTHCMFRGLEPHPNREGWMMFVGLA